MAADPEFYRGDDTRCDGCQASARAAELERLQARVDFLEGVLVRLWHETPTDKGLAEWLGMDRHEYAKWAQGKTLP